MRLFKNKSFYISLFALAMPIALQDLIKFGTNMLDNVMVGSLSEVEISAVSMANQPFFIYALLVFGLTSGGTVLAAQYHGKGDIQAVRKVVNITFAYAMAAAAFFTLFVLCFPEITMSIFTPEPEVIRAGAEYLRILGFAYPFYAATTVCIMMLRSVQITLPTLIVNIISFFVNAFLNWVLIFGNLGAPAMGVRGAALATLAARVLEAVLCVCNLRFADNPLRFRFSGLKRLSRSLQRDFFRYSMPVTLNEFIWGLGTACLSVVLGRLGTEAMAASSITSSVASLMSVMLFGTSGAAGILIGRAVGGGDYAQAKRNANSSLFVSVCIGVIVCAVVLLLRDFIIGLYNISPDTVSVVRSFLTLAAVLLIFESVGLNVITGTLRGGGDTKFAMYIDILSLWALALPLGALMAFVFEAPLFIVFCALRCDVFVRCVACLFRVRGTKWIRNVTLPLASDG